MTPPTPARRRLRWPRRAAVFLVVLAIGVWFAPGVVARTGLRNRALGRVFADLNGTVEAGGASLGWLSPVELHDVRVTDPAGQEALTAERVTSSRTLLALVWDRTDLGTFTIDHPILTVVCEPGTTNVEQAVANWLTDDRQPRPERAGLVVAASDGTVRFRETGRAGEQVLEAVNLTLTIPRPRAEPVTLDVSARAAEPTGGGAVAARCTFHDGAEARLTADRFPAGACAPLVRRFSPETTAEGRVTADLTAKWGTVEPGQTRAEAEGRVAVDGLVLGGPWLGPDRVRVRQAELSGRGGWAVGSWRIDTAELRCDAGTVAVAGSISPEEPVGRLLTRPGVRIDADLEAARLAAILPRLLRVRDRTELREGRLAVHLLSKPAPDGTAWEGTVRTSAVRGVRDGKAIIWEQPLAAKLTGRVRRDGTPVALELEAQSDFVGLAARGTPDRFLLMANLNLDRLSARLAEFVDLGGAGFGGTGALTVRSEPRPGAEGFTALVTGQFTNVSVTGPSGRGFREPSLNLSGRAAGRLGDGGSARLDSGDLILSAGGDVLAVTLAGPTAFEAVRLDARLTGDLGRWWGRAGAVVAVPTGIDLAGTGTVAGTVAVTGRGVTADRLTARFTDARARGAVLSLAEPAVTAECGAAWDRSPGTFTLTDVRLAGETLSASARRVELKPTPSGYGLSAAAAVTANLAWVQRAVELQTDPAGGDAVGGTARGTVALDSTGGLVRFDADLSVERFTYGPPAKPTWTEPVVKVVAAGDYDTPSEAVRFRSLRVERDGLAVTATGSIARFASTRDLDLGGTLSYDLARLESQLRGLLGRDGRAVGAATEPFKLTGRLSGGQGPFAGLNGTAVVAWQSVRAHGIDVGPAALRLSIERGTVTSPPVEATFGGGKVRLRPTLDLASKDYDLRFAPGRVVEQARLTPAACAGAFGYALPAIANVARADGLASFDLEESRIPLFDADRSAVRGKLAIHSATVSLGPIVTEVATLLGARETTATLANDQVVPVRLENGRVYHDNFTLTLGASAVRTSGSVGLDGSLALVLDLPVPHRMVDRLLPNNPRVRDAVARQRLKVPVGGTLSRPQLDPRAFEAAAEAVVRSAARDAARSAADDLLRKGLGELGKRLGPAPPPKK